MAYILGFWFADGCIYKNRSRHYYFSITQHKKDQYLLKLILKKMNSNYPLQKNKNCFQIAICSKVIYDDIIRLGGKERKSLDVKFPKVPKKYLPDFIRGLWDGDGSVSSNKKNKNYEASLVSGSKIFINQLYRTLKNSISHFGARVNTSCDKKGKQICGRILKKDSVCYYIKLSANNVKRLRDFLYRNKNGLKMIRKYKKFLEAGKIVLSNSDKSRKFWKFNKARNFIRKLNLCGNKEWKEYCSSGLKPDYIPSHPFRSYEGEWLGMSEWLGE
jgi:hypothetical protein